MTNQTPDDVGWLKVLDYEDPAIKRIDADVVIRRARRLRVIRRSSGGLAVLALAAAVITATTHFVLPHPSTVQSTTAPLSDDSFLEQHRPVGDIAYIDKPNSNWVVAVWISTAGEICRASFQGRSATNLDQSCPSAPANLLTNTAPSFVEPKMFFATPPTTTESPPLSA